MFKITKVKIKEEKMDQPPAVQANMQPRHPFRTYIVGASGSGKTNYLLSVLTRFWSGYWDRIYVFSMTAKKLDKSYQVLNLPDENFFDCSLEALNLIFKIQQKDIKENGKTNSSKCLLIFDDCVSNKPFMRGLIKPFIMMRHYNCSAYLLSQAFHLVQKSVRINCSNLIFFKGSMVECLSVVEQYCPPNMTKKQFLKIVQEATREPYSFLYVDLMVSISDGRYRQNLENKIV